jgi:putative holliday junction resolvase
MEKKLETLLGFDFGTKRIGVAVGQMLMQTASPLCVLPAKEGVPDWKAVGKLIKDWQPDALIVGLPLNMDGTEQTLTIYAKTFGESLENQFGLPVLYMDERLSSVEARARLFEAGGYKQLKKSKIDSVAAQLILEDWLKLHHSK